jgi:hypothetical protein
MSRKLMLLVLGIAFVLMTAMSGHAGMFVATAKNLRGALYLGAGPTPQHASEQAMVKCSQDSFVPPSCRVVCVRMECPPPVCAPPMRKPIRKSKVSQAYPPQYSWGRPMP